MDTRHLKNREQMQLVSVAVRWHCCRSVRSFEDAISCASIGIGMGTLVAKCLCVAGGGGNFRNNFLGG